MSLDTLIPKNNVKIPKKGKYSLLMGIAAAIVSSIMLSAGCDYANNTNFNSEPKTNQEYNIKDLPKYKIDVGKSGVNNLSELWVMERKEVSLDKFVNQVIKDNRFNPNSALINDTGQIRDNGSLILRDYDGEPENLAYIKE